MQAINGTLSVPFPFFSRYNRKNSEIQRSKKRPKKKTRLVCQSNCSNRTVTERSDHCGIDKARQSCQQGFCHRRPRHYQEFFIYRRSTLNLSAAFGASKHPFRCKKPYYSFQYFLQLYHLFSAIQKSIKLFVIKSENGALRHRFLIFYYSRI